MQVGEVRVAEDADFAKLKDLCTCHDGWRQDYNKNGTTVWTKANDVSDFKLIKVRTLLKDVSAATLYDVLHDPVYRKIWDNNMIEGYEICMLNPMNDIGYYALRTPKPLKRRDFVILRSWLETQKEYYIINHSVNHAAIPPKKNYVRGISYMTGYYLTPFEDRKLTDTGCVVAYVTQSDPKGKLPSWFVNRITQLMAPKIMSKMHKACRGYASWKSKHQPQHKPWLYPEQQQLPRLDPADIQSMRELLEAQAADETNLLEDDFDGGVDSEDGDNNAANGVNGQ